MSRSAPTLLAEGYWWSDSADGSTLYLRYSWVASVERGKVEVRTRTGGRTSGRCGSIEQGKRHVERWVEAQSRAAYRRWRERWNPPPGPPPPTPAQLAAARQARRAAAAPLPPLPRPAPRTTRADDNEWETWAWRQDVPLERVIEALKGRR